MEDYTVKRLGLILSVQARIDGMKVANACRDKDDPSYRDEDFRNESEKLENIAYSHPDQL